MRTLWATAGLLLVSALASLAAEPWSLERSLDYAFAHNPDARITASRIAAAQAALEQANSAFWPKLQVQSSYTRTDNPMQVFGSILNQRSYSTSLNFNDVPDLDSLNARGVLTVPLYTGGRNTSSRQAASANAEAARHDKAATLNALGFEITRAFLIVLKTRQFINAAQAALTSFETNLVVAQKRLDAGTLLRSEKLDIEVRAAQAREDLIRARSASILAQRGLRNLLGIEDGDFVVADSAPDASVPRSADVSQRPELVAARVRENAAAAQLRAAKSGYQPRVGAFGSLDYDYGWVTHGDGKSYTAGIVAQWDLWDGFSTRSKAREAQANLDAACEEQRKLRLAIDLEVEKAQLDLKASEERLAATSKAIEQASESASLTRHRFEQGLALSSQLIDAETAVVSARVRRTEAESDHRIAVAALRKALAWPQLDRASPTN